MSFGTVFPDMVIGFAEAIAGGMHERDVMFHTDDANGELSAEQTEDILRIAAACHSVRQHVAVAMESTRKALVNGVEIACFLAVHEPILARLDRLFSRNAVTLAQANGNRAIAARLAQLLKALQELNDALVSYRDLLRNAIGTMKAPRVPVDWQRVQAANDAFLQGETEPFKPAL